MTEGEQQRIFEHWLQEHKALLLKVIRTYAFSEADRDDLFQEISIQVWRSVPNFREESTVTTWLYCVALNTAIKSQKERASRKTNMNDFGLTVIFIATVVIYCIRFVVNGTPTVFDYLIVIALLFITGYIWYGRIRRKKQEQTFGRTMLDDLNHAISSVQYEAKRSKNMVWWFVMPLAVLVFMDMSQADASLWRWLGIGAAFILSALLTRWEYKQCHKPRLRKLEALRKKLTEAEN